MSMANRILEIFVGLILFVAGAGIIYAFHTLNWPHGLNIWDAGFLILAEGYSIIGSLLILLGIRYTFGRRSFIEQRISRSLAHFVIVMVLLSLLTLAAMIYTLR